MKSPVIIYSCKGMIHLVYCIWSIRSLKKFKYAPIEVIVSNEKERKLFASRCPGVTCSVLDADMGSYPPFSYKPFILARYLNEVGVQHKGREIVICDADILWKRDPAELFKRFKGRNWVHKITAVSPKDYEMVPGEVPLSNIGLRTINNYAKRHEVRLYPNFVVNAGLFMLPENVFPDMLDNWLRKIYELPPEEMLMSEALLSLTYAEMALEPVCDRGNIKHLGKNESRTDSKVLSFKIAPDCPDGQYTGYETASHYYGDQRRFLHRNAKAMGLDFDNLYSLIRRDLVIKGIKKFLGFHKKAVKKLQNRWNKRNLKTIYYVIDKKGWIQHRRFLVLKERLASYRFRLATKAEFKILWRLNLLRKKFVYFSSWRIAHALLKDNPKIFGDSDFDYFMAAVTSHSNIGGGLDPLNPIPGREPKEAFRLAIDILKRFKVVSVNSMILYELLENSLPNLFYCPNGVDTNFFIPQVKRSYNPSNLRIGWVGRERGPKNYTVIEEAKKRLESMGGVKFKIIKTPKGFKRAPLSFAGMRQFYRNIDFYLCASLNEGTPNPALEAGSCGIPVITTRVGNMKELIKPSSNGFFVEPTADSIEKRFKEIRKISTENYERMRQEMRDAIVRDWSWDIRIRNFSEAFKRLVA